MSWCLSNVRVFVLLLAACAAPTSTIANHAAPAPPLATNPICTVRAHLDTRGIAYTINLYNDTLEACYPRYGPQRVAATVTAGADGHVQHAEVGGAAHDLEACVCNALAKLTFEELPPNTTAIVVTYPFALTPAE